jgi:hypothetical protein
MVKVWEDMVGGDGPCVAWRGFAAAMVGKVGGGI